ncbi:MAG: hypothetical protein FJ315_05415 [SAR202 cluster bacterium]|nr:hypothetical protein [SAR202 cluster bacterium]
MPTLVVHFEIPVRDPNKGNKFYGDLFGWKVQPVPQMDYGLVDTGSRERLAAASPGRPGGRPIAL